MQHEELATLITENKMKIMFMGCVDTKGTPFRQEDDLYDAYVDTYEMRKELLDLIFASNTRTQLSAMNILAPKVAEVRKALNLTTENFVKFLTINDWTLGNSESRLIQHENTMKVINEFKSILACPDLATDYASFLVESKNFVVNFKGDAAIKSRILWPLKLDEPMS